jgi:hypothetical protein
VALTGPAGMVVDWAKELVAVPVVALAAVTAGQKVAANLAAAEEVVRMVDAREAEG